VKRTVLLLEDNDSLAHSIMRTLEVEGHSVTRFRNLREARAAIPPIGFGVLLCDYELPDGTGLDFLGEVQQSTGDLTDWTTILCSGLDRSGIVEASGIPVEHVIVKGARGVSEILQILAA
jgi:DNA-binding NtrC family response regulator